MTRANRLTCYFVVCLAFGLSGVFPEVKFPELSPELSQCYRRFANVTLDRAIGKFLCWHCEEPFRLRNSRRRMTSSQRSYVHGLADKIDSFGNGRGKRQVRRCVRKEYRMLTTQERNDFHRAVNGLKQNTVSLFRIKE